MSSTLTLELPFIHEKRQGICDGIDDEYLDGNKIFQRLFD